MKLERKKNIEQVLLASACAASLISTLVLAFRDQTTAAGITGALTLALLVFVNLPLIEYFKVLGLEAKLRSQVSEAEKLLSLLRDHAMTSSKIMLHQLAYSNVLAEPSWDTQRDFLEEIEENLREHSIDQAELDSIKRPLLNFFLMHLLKLANSAINERIDFHQIRIHEEFAREFPGGVRERDRTDERYVRLDRERKSLHPDQLGSQTAWREGREVKPKATFDEMLHKSNLPFEDRGRLQSAFTEMVDIAEEVATKLSITQRAIDFLNGLPKPNGWVTFYGSAFPEPLETTVTLSTGPAAPVENHQ